MIHYYQHVISKANLEYAEVPDDLVFDAVRGQLMEKVEYNQHGMFTKEKLDRGDHVIFRVVWETVFPYDKKKE